MADLPHTQAAPRRQKCLTRGCKGPAASQLPAHCRHTICLLAVKSASPGRLGAGRVHDFSVGVASDVEGPVILLGLSWTDRRLRLRLGQEQTGKLALAGLVQQLGLASAAADRSVLLPVAEPVSSVVAPRYQALGSVAVRVVHLQSVLTVLGQHRVELVRSKSLCHESFPVQDLIIVAVKPR